MANLTSVVYSSGALASTVTGTVSTIDQLIAGGMPVSQSGTWTMQPGNTANTTPWLSKLNDGTTSFTVKASSVAPSAADTAVVVALSPNGLNPNGATLSANSAPVVLPNDQKSLAVYQDTSALANGNNNTLLTPSFASLSVTAAGATTIVASVAAKRIRVLAAVLTSSGSTNVKFQSHVTPTDLTGFFYEVANTGFVLNYNPVGWFQTVSGESLDINCSASIGVGGCIVYVTV